MFKSGGATTQQEYFEQLAEPRKSEILELHNFILKEVPELEPFMQSGMLAYGPYHYKYASGREGDWCVVALASQKNYISLYITAVEDNQYVAETYKDKLPKASLGKSCIRFKKLADIDLDVIAEILHKAKKWWEQQ